MNATGAGFSLGTFQCTVLHDGTFHYPPEPFFAGIPPEDREKAIETFGGMPESLASPWTCLFVRTGDHKVLIDCGGGNAAITAFPGTGQLAAAMESNGISPGEIDTVILTHGHPDHIGGSIDAEGHPAVGTARYVMLGDEWRFWTSEAHLQSLEASGNDMQASLASFARRCLPPIEPQLDLLERDAEVVPGIEAIAAPGHTPGHMVVRIQSGGDGLLYLADTTVHPLFLENPSWRFVIDVDQDAALSSRKRVCEMAVSEDLLVLGPHFHSPGLGHIVGDGSAWRWERTD